MCNTHTPRNIFTRRHFQNLKKNEKLYHVPLWETQYCKDAILMQTFVKHNVVNNQNYRRLLMKLAY